MTSASLEHLDPRAAREKQDQQVPQERLAWLASPGQLDPEGPRGPRGPQVHQGRGMRLDLVTWKALGCHLLPAPLDHAAPVDHRVCQDYQGSRARWAALGSLARQAQRGMPVCLVWMAALDWKASLDHRVQKATVAALVRRVNEAKTA